MARGPELKKRRRGGELVELTIGKAITTLLRVPRSEWSSGGSHTAIAHNN
jgi:hypothetical protein